MHHLRLASQERWARALLVAALLPALTAIHLWIGAEHRRALDHQPIVPRRDAIYLAPEPVMRVMALGRHTFMADVLWLRALSYFAVHFGTDKEYRWLDPLVQTIIDLDPRFRKVYHWASVVVMYGGRIDQATVEASNRVLEQAVQRFPDDWEFHFMLGCNYVFELRSPDPAERAEQRRIGADAIRRAASLPGAPPWLPLTAAALSTKAGERELAIRHLEEVYLRTNDEAVRVQIAIKLKKLQDEHAVSVLDARRARFDAAWKASWPYVPPDLFVLLGERYDGRVEPVWRQPDEPAEPDVDEATAP